MSWRDFVGRILTAGPYRRFERDCRHPEAAQERVWQECRERVIRGSFWNRLYSGKIPERLEDFPVTAYGDYQSAIREAFSGTRSPLTNDRVDFWCTSSGTSGERKYFPLTRAHLRQSARTAPPQFNRLLREYPGFFDGKTLSMAAPFTGERSPAGIPVGLLSTSLYLRASSHLDLMLAVPGAVMRSTEAFETWASLYVMTSDLSAIVGMTPLGTCRLFEAIENDWERNRKIILGEMPLPEGLPRLKIPSARRRYLRALLSRPQEGGKKLRSINLLWPKLRAIFGWKSSVCAAQLPLLESYLTEPTPTLDGQYSATEAWFNVPLTTELGGPLHLGAHVFEFLPLEAEPVRENILKPWQLEPGRDYEILITNAMGLVRYRIFDVVRCVGYHHRSPVISFQSKAQGLLGLDAATVRESEVIDAMTAASLPMDGTLLCSPAPEANRLVFFQVGGKPVSLAGFEKELRRISETYARSRALEDTEAPVLVEVREESPEAALLFPKLRMTGIRAQDKIVAVATRCPLDAEKFSKLRSGR